MHNYKHSFIIVLFSLYKYNKISIVSGLNDVEFMFWIRMSDDGVEVEA